MALVNGKQPVSPRSLTNHVNSRALGNRDGSRDEQNSSTQKSRPVVSVSKRFSVERKAEADGLIQVRTNVYVLPFNYSLKIVCFSWIHQLILRTTH